MASKNFKLPAVFRHYEIPTTIPEGDFKAKCNYCGKEFAGSLKATTNWWKHLVRKINELL